MRIGPDARSNLPGNLARGEPDEGDGGSHVLPCLYALVANGDVLGFLCPECASREMGEIVSPKITVRGTEFFHKWQENGSYL